MKRVAILVAAVAFTLSINMKVFATGVENVNNTEVKEAAVITETVQEDTTNETEAVVNETITDSSIDEEVTEDAGIMPDSIFYILDKAFDNFRLFLTFDDEKKIGILSEIANERLLESEIMTKEEKYELAMSAIEEFNNLITEAADLIEEPAIEEPAIEELAIEEPVIEEPTLNESEIDESEIKLAKKAAVANMVEKRHALNKARQEYQSAIVDLKKVIKSGEEEAIIAAEELLKEKQGSYKDTVETFKIAFEEMKDTRNYNKESDVKIEEVKVDEDKVEVADEEKIEEEKIEEENTISNIEDEKVVEAKKVEKAKEIKKIKRIKEIKEIKEMKEAKEKTEKKETRNENEKKENNERTNEHKENNND